MKYFFILVILATSMNMNAQLEKVLHQTFEVSDETNQINLDLAGEYKIFQWAGNTILTETKIQLYEASPGVFKHFLGSGRYEILDESDETAVQLVSKDQERKEIRTKKGACPEIVEIRIFVPEDFVSVNDRLLKRKTSTTTAQESSAGQK